MSGADFLFSVKTTFYIGAYRQCVKEAQKSQAPDQTIALERDIFMYRAYLGEGKHGLVLDEVSGRKGPEFRALTLLAKYLQSPANKEGVMAQVNEVLEAGGASLSPDTVALLCANIFMLDGDNENALRITHSASSIDCMALTAQILLQINRVDLARKEVKKMQDLDEDATVSQLSLAALYIATGQDKIQDAFYIYQELAEKFTPTPLLLNGMATCYILQGKLEMAEDILQKALDKESNHPETLINLYVVSQCLGAGESAKRYFSQLRDAHKDHRFVTDLAAKEVEFDTLAAALISNR